MLAQKDRSVIYNPPKSAKHAAIMVCLFNKNNQYHTLFITRASHSKDKHKGQVAFPGGKIESNETILQAAYREIDEEIGLPKSRIKFLGNLSPLYIPVSDFAVHPVVSWIEIDEWEPILQPSEVAEMHAIPLSQFTNKKNITTRKHTTFENFSIEAPCFVVENLVIWGATAMILNEFLEVFKNLEL